MFNYEFVFNLQTEKKKKETCEGSEDCYFLSMISKGWVLVVVLLIFKEFGPLNVSDDPVGHPVKS